MRKALKFLLIPAAFAMVAGTGLAATTAPAKADVGFGLYFGTPGPRYYRPAPYYYRPYNCYWDAYYGRVCY
jgi:hypothetical protein